MSNKLITVYWKDGKREVLKGTDIKTAFTDAGYSSFSITDVSWITEGLTNSHRFDAEKSEWMKYDPIRMQFTDLNIDENMTKDKFVDEYRDLFIKHGGIYVDMPNMDRVSIEISTGTWSYGSAEYISVECGEYHKGTYYGDSDDEENSHYYMGAGTWEYRTTDIDKALRGFYMRLTLGTNISDAHDVNSVSVKQLCAEAPWNKE